MRGAVDVKVSAIRALDDGLELLCRVLLVLAGHDACLSKGNLQVILGVQVQDGLEVGVLIGQRGQRAGAVLVPLVRPEAVAVPAVHVGGPHLLKVAHQVLQCISVKRLVTVTELGPATAVVVGPQAMHSEAVVLAIMKERAGVG